MYGKQITSLLIAILVSGAAWAENQPLACQEDSVAGLKWESGRWNTTSFIEGKFILVMDGNTLTPSSVAKVFYSKMPEEWVSCQNATIDSYIVQCFEHHVTGGVYLAFNTDTLEGGLARIAGATFDSDGERDDVGVITFSCVPY